MYHSSLALGSLAQRGDQTSWLQCADRAWTSHQVIRRVATLSRALSRVLHVEPGCRVLLLGGNSDWYIQALLACMDAGAIVVPVNSRWSATELAYALQWSGAKLALVDEQHLDLVAKACDGSRLQPPELLLIGPPDQQAQQHHLRSSSMTTEQLITKLHHMQGQLKGCTPQSADRAPGGGAPSAQHHGHAPTLQLLSAPEGAALICFTSGTTGRPKGVVLTHANIHVQSLAKLVTIGYCPQDTYLHLAPLFHVGGLSSLFAVLMAGGAHVVLPKFDAAGALHLIRARGVTSFIAVPTMIEDMAQAAKQLGQGGGGSWGSGAAGAASGSAQGPHGPRSSAPWLGQWQSVKKILVGAGGTSSHMKAALLQMFPQASLHTAYGMTEACSSITFKVLHTPHAQAQASAALAAAGAEPPLAEGPPGPCGSAVPPGAPTEVALGAAAGASSSSPSSSSSSSWGSCAGYPAPGIQVMIHASDDSSHVAGSSAGSPGAGSVCHTPASMGHDDRSIRQLTGGEDRVRVVGEVWTRGPHVMQGYWRDPEQTAQAFAAGGWLRTGDLGYLDAGGQLWLLGRMKDMIKSGGENVFAPEVEAVLCQHPSVVAAAVVGLSDDRLTEMVAATVLLHTATEWSGPFLQDSSNPSLGLLADALPPSTPPNTSNADAGHVSTGNLPQLRLTPKLLQEWCRSRGLSGFKLPRFICAQWHPFPTNASGKVLKQEIKAQIEHQLHPQANADRMRSRM